MSLFVLTPKGSEVVFLPTCLAKKLDDLTTVIKAKENSI